jgi:hypothetical protein
MRAGPGTAHVYSSTGEVIRRYEHETPGALIHVDVKKLGNIPNGGGWRYVAGGKAIGIGLVRLTNRMAATAIR